MSTEPQTKLSLLDRLLADSPAFWKKVNYIGLFIGAIVAAIQTNFPEFPKTWLGLLAGISVGLVAASQFAVKDTGALAKQNPTIDDYVKTAVDIKNQYQEVKQAVTDAVESGKIPESKTDINSEILDITGQSPLKYYNLIDKIQAAAQNQMSPAIAPSTPIVPSDPSNANGLPTATLISSEPPTPVVNQTHPFSNPAANPQQ